MAVVLASCLHLFGVCFGVFWFGLTVLFGGWHGYRYCDLFVSCIIEEIDRFDLTVCFIAGQTSKAFGYEGSVYS